jgi:hypothetical protein
VAVELVLVLVQRVEQLGQPQVLEQELQQRELVQVLEQLLGLVQVQQVWPTRHRSRRQR